MIFTTYWFCVFAAITIPLYLLVPWPKARLVLLLVACAVFHAHFAGAAGVVPIIVLAVATYLAGRSGRPGWCAAAIVLCVAALGLYKYAGFFVDALLGLFDRQFAAQAAAWVKHVLPATPPLAISFFTFEFVHYLYDVRKGRMRIGNPLDFALFAIFFPSLVAGPIKRCGDFLPALHRGVAGVGPADVAQGLGRVAQGFVKKVVVSDNLAQMINYYGPNFTHVPLAARWALLAMIAFRILFDFSGYSDIAIGLARMFGITLVENFNWPYLARNLQEFWQRWHISLSTWIRDYIYIPLGGSRFGTGRKIINGFIVFALCGLWHGAAWNFIVWGLFHGAGLAVCGNYRLLFGRFGVATSVFFERFPPLSWVITTGYVWFSWLLFFYPLPQAWRMAASLFSLVKYLSSVAVCVGAIMGFLACCVLGRLAARKDIYKHFFRLHPNIEAETSYYPTASQLVTIVRGRCPLATHKVLVLIGGNSIFNGSGQHGEQLWSRILQNELGDRYQVINLSAPGAGLMDNGGVVFEALSQEYPQAIFVTNTEPGSYPAANQSAYNYLFWDACYKGLLPEAVHRIIPHTPDDDTPSNRELKLGQRLNGALYFNDLWNYVSYRYLSTVWTSWLRERSFLPRHRLPDWYDKRPAVVGQDSTFEKLLPDHLEMLRHRPSVTADRFQQNDDGAWVQTAECLQEDKKRIAILLPEPLQHRALIVLTPFNPWFITRLHDAEQTRLFVNFENAAALLTEAGFHVLPLHNQGFKPSDFGDTMHLSPAGGRRLAQLVATSIREMNTQSAMAISR